MKLKRLGANVTELETPRGVRILFSYETPVAAMVPIGTIPGWSENHTHYRSDRFFSRTTSAHVSSWLAGKKWCSVEHSFIVSLAEGA